MKNSVLAFDSIIRESIEKSNNIFFEKVEGSSQRAYLIAELFKSSKRDILVILEEGSEATLLKNDLSFFTEAPVLEFPALDMTSSKERIVTRQKTLSAIVHNSQSPKIVLSTLQATMQKVPSYESLCTSSSLLFKNGQRFVFDSLIEEIVSLGYEKRGSTTLKGEFSVRGGIIDLFPAESDFPIRIEFFDDEIESIRLFDPNTQKSIEAIPSITVHSIQERASEEETLFSLLKRCKAMVLFTDIEKVEDHYTEFSGYSTILQKGATSSTVSKISLLDEWIASLIEASLLIFMTDKHFEELVDEGQSQTKKSWESYPVEKRVQSFPLFEKEWKCTVVEHPLLSLGLFYLSEALYKALPSGEALLDAYAIAANRVDQTFIVQSAIEKSWLEEKLAQRDIAAESVKIIFGYLSSGFARIDIKQSFISINDITGLSTVKKRVHERDTRVERKKVDSEIQFSTGFDAYSLEPRDFVVHFHHGIGRFLGVEKRANSQGVEQEFFLIEYTEGSKLYVPLHQAHLLTKYIGAGEVVPKLHALGSLRWKKIREETEKAIIGYASELLKAYAQREVVGGIEYPPDSPAMKLFEAEFPYQETEDQIQAILDVKQDMCSKKAMDRLICGDVGYGKTEIAIRAAFKAIVDGKKQVALLVPTTVLALQHYDNFYQRMNPFGIRIGILSRFQSTKQNRETLEKVSLGEIDLVIGTHKLLQKGMQFQDLGLVIVDEEQRFGVKAKEHLKTMKSGVDCLTLSATPIPRTLYMSLSGARELSTIASPPHDRIPIESAVLYFDPEIIETAIARELYRGGQLFYIHNRVETITDAVRRLQKMAPRARIMAVHGQMSTDEVEAIFHAFKKNEIDILVATTIIENGIDIPNANTIIVENADQFGIAELYQLRGRVGRSNKKAFAYFLLSPGRYLSEIAQKRIEAISQAGGYGGGLKLAMRDLEIRGAGDILGTEQSGHVATIGFQLYCKLLKRTVASLQGEKAPVAYDVKIEVPYPAKIPEQYIQEVSTRIELYQRLGDAQSELQVAEIEKEMEDRFGKMPKEAKALMIVSKIRVLAALKGISFFKIEGSLLTIERKRGKDFVRQQKWIREHNTLEKVYSSLTALLEE